jgi:hypothetical protein
VDAGQTADDRITLSKMRVRSRKSTDRGTPDETDSGKDLGNFTGFAHSRISPHFHAVRTGYSTTTYDPIAAFLPGRLFTRSEITRRMEKEQAFIRWMTA